MCLNFRTTFNDQNGFRENQPKRIAANYLRGWFLIDFVSCLPFGYVGVRDPNSVFVVCALNYLTTQTSQTH